MLSGFAEQGDDKISRKKERKVQLIGMLCSFYTVKKSVQTEEACRTLFGECDRVLTLQDNQFLGDIGATEDVDSRGEG